MALCPDVTDPNYKQQMKRFKENPEDWQPIGDASRPYPDTPTPEQQAATARGYLVEQLRREFCAHHNINHVDKPVVTQSIVEALFVSVGEDADKTRAKFDDGVALTLLKSAGLK